MRIRALLLSLLLLASPAYPAQAQTTGVWGERGLSAMPDARVGREREVELGTRLIALRGLPTALAGYGRFSLLSTDATVLYGVPGHDWPLLSVKHQLQRPSLANPTAVAIGLGNLGVPASPGLPGSNLYVVVTRDFNLRQDGRDWTLFAGHLGFRADLNLNSRLMAGLELPLGQHGTATAEWIGAQGNESGYANFSLNLSPLAGLNLSLFSLGLPNATLFDRGLAVGASYQAVLPDWQAKRAEAPKPSPKPKPAAAPPLPPKSLAELPNVKTSVAPPPLPPVPVLPSAAPQPKPAQSAAPVQPRGTLIGRAVDANGKALSNVTITLSAASAPKRETKTTPSGYFTFGDLSPGSYDVAASDAAGLPIGSKAIRVDGATIEVTLKPEATFRLKGQIVDSRTGSALSGASVTVGTARVESDRDGYFSLDGLPAAPWTVSVKAKGYADGAVKVSEGSPRIALSPRPGSVSGRIVTTTGKPVSGAIAQLGTLRTATDQDGRYLLENVPAGKHSLALQQDGKTLLTASVQVPPGGKAVKDAQVREAAPVGRFGMIGGQVRNTAGEALQGVKIIVEGKAVTVLTVTDDEGRFSVTELLPGDYRLKLSKGSYSDQEAQTQVKAGSLASLNLILRNR